MRAVGIAVVVLVVVLFLVWWIPGLWPHAKQAGRDIGSAINKASSDEHIIGLYEEALNGIEKELRDRYAAVYRVKTEMAKLESIVKTQQEQLTQEERILQEAQKLLKEKQPGSPITIGTVTFSWEQVNQDAFNRLNVCKQLRKQIESNAQLLNKLKQAHDDGVRMIAEKLKELRQKKLEFEAEKAELAALRAQEEVNILIGGIYKGGSSKNDLELARKAFEERLNELRAKAEFDQQMRVGPTGTIPWPLKFNESVYKSIESYFLETGSQQPKK